MTLRPLFTLLLCCSFGGAFADLAGAQKTEAEAATRDDQKSAPPLRLMSFNIRYGTANDGDNSWPKRTTLVRDTITRFAPDVLGVQEAVHFQMTYLQAQLEGYQSLGEGREGGEKGEYSALFVRSERLEVLDSGQYWLSPTPDTVGSMGWDAALPRVCTWAKLKDRANGGHEFLVANTHFDHRGSEARTQSAKLIASRLPTDLPCIVMGDLNAAENSAPMDALRAAKLVDTFRALHPDATPAGSFGGFSGRVDGAKIDAVMTRGPWKVLEAAIDRYQEDGRYPSDHYPVNAVLQWPSRERQP